MRILVALDSFKGSLSCTQATAAAARGLQRVWPHADIRQLPLADGGEGTLEAILAVQGGRRRTAVVQDPLGRPVQAEWALLPDGNTAMVELAQAAGLTLLSPKEFNPATATTYGVGELINAAVAAGCSRIILSVGGSATIDGGAGLVQALGARLLDQYGASIPSGGLGLERIDDVDTSDLLRRLHGVHLQVACDVENPLCGPEGAAFVFGPQKGADRALCERLDAALEHYGRCLQRRLGVDVLQVARGGAAGGTAAGLLAMAGAELVSGGELVLELTGGRQELALSDLIITGEGRVDGQTLQGKVVSTVVKAALGKPVVVLAGQLSAGHEQLYQRGVGAMLAAVDGPMTLDEAMDAAESLLEATGERCARLLSVGGSLGEVLCREN